MPWVGDRHYDSEIMAERERRRREFEESRIREAELEKSIPYHVGHVLGSSFSHEALMELAMLLHYAEYNFGPPSASTFLKELMEHEPIRPKS